LGIAHVAGNFEHHRRRRRNRSRTADGGGRHAIAAGANNVTLNSAANALSGTVTVTGHDVVLANALAIDLVRYMQDLD